MHGNINERFMFIAGVVSIVCVLIAIILLRLLIDHVLWFFAILFFLFWGYGSWMACFGATILCKDLIKDVNLDDLPPKGKSTFEVRARIIFNKKRLLGIFLKPDTTKLESENQIEEEKSDEK